MKLQRLVIRRINQRTNALPDDAVGQWLLLLNRDPETRKTTERRIFFCHATLMPTVYEFTHYAIIPDYLNP